MNIFESAINNWPEDEAAMTVRSYNDRKENDWPADELKEGLEKDICHMHKVFSSEDDAEQLIARYDRYIKENLIK